MRNHWNLTLQFTDFFKCRKDESFTEMTLPIFQYPLNTDYQMNTGAIVGKMLLLLSSIADNCLEETK